MQRITNPYCILLQICNTNPIKSSKLHLSPELSAFLDQSKRRKRRSSPGDERGPDARENCQGQGQECLNRKIKVRHKERETIKSENRSEKLEYRNLNSENDKDKNGENFDDIKDGARDRGEIDQQYSRNFQAGMNSVVDMEEGSDHYGYAQEDRDLHEANGDQMKLMNHDVKEITTTHETDGKMINYLWRRN